MVAMILIWESCLFFLRYSAPETRTSQLCIYCVLFGFSPILFQYCGLSDLFSLGFFLFSTALSVKVLLGEKEGLKPMAWALGIGIAAYLTCLFRYAYYFFFWIPIFILILYAFADKRLWKYVFISCFVTSILLALQLSQQSGKEYVQSRHTNDRHLYWEDLSLTTNFVADSFYETEIVGVICSKILPGSETSFSDGVTQMVLTSLILGIFIVFLVKWIKPVWGWERIKWKEFLSLPKSSFVLFAVTTVLCNVLVIIVLTVFLGRVAIGGDGGVFWTYVEEKRYFAPLAVVLWLVLVMAKSYSFRAYQLSMIVIAVTALCGFLQNGSKIKSYHEYKGIESLYYMSGQIYAERDKINVFITPSLSQNYAEYASMAGARLCTTDSAIKSNLKASVPVVLYIPVPSDLPSIEDKRKLEILVKKTNARVWMKVKTYGITTIYRTIIRPKPRTMMVSEKAVSWHQKISDGKAGLLCQK